MNISYFYPFISFLCDKSSFSKRAKLTERKEPWPIVRHTSEVRVIYELINRQKYELPRGGWKEVISGPNFAESTNFCTLALTSIIDNREGGGIGNAHIPL